MELRHLYRRILPTSIPLPPLPFVSVPFYPHHLLFSTSSSAPHFMVEYLVSTCGFSPDAAVKAAPCFAHLTSPAKPDAVLAFFRSQGLDATQISHLLSVRPMLLCSRVDTTLSPKFRAVEAAFGLDRADVGRLFAAYPTALHWSVQCLLARLSFWHDIFGSTKLLMKCFTRTWILKYSPNLVSLNMSVLRSLGVTDRRILVVVRRHPTVITKPPDKFRAVVDRVMACGIPPSSSAFVWAVAALHNTSEARFNAKREYMMSLGWSEEQFQKTLLRAPTTVLILEDQLRRKVAFLKGRAGCSTEYIACSPVLLNLSLEGRMVPRYNAIEVLRSRGVDIGTKMSIISILRMPEDKFREKFILRFKDQVPELSEMYTSQCRRGRLANDA